MRMYRRAAVICKLETIPCESSNGGVEDMEDKENYMTTTHCVYTLSLYNRGWIVEI